MFFPVVLCAGFERTVREKSPTVLLRRIIDAPATREFEVKITSHHISAFKGFNTEGGRKVVTEKFTEIITPPKNEDSDNVRYVIDSVRPTEGGFGVIPGKKCSSIKGKIDILNHRSKLQNDLQFGPLPFEYPKAPLKIGDAWTVTGIPPFGSLNFPPGPMTCKFLGRRIVRGALCNLLQVRIDLHGPYDPAQSMLGESDESGTEILKGDVYLRADDGDLEFERLRISISEFRTVGVPVSKRSTSREHHWTRFWDKSLMEVWRL